MKASELLKMSGIDNIMETSKDFEVKGITYDSRKVRPGYVFFAIKGLKDDGSRYSDDAVINGAGLIIHESDFASEKTVEIKVDSIRKKMAVMSSKFYGDPSSRLKLIGVTGTNGKTTTTYLIQSFLNDAGYKTGLIGTINYQAGKLKMESSLTTPDSVELNMMLGEMVSEGMDFCVMEVSSIALSLDRVYGLNYDTAVFTNLTSEHLDFHKDMNNYFSAKKILFDNLKKDALAVSNADDQYGVRITDGTKAKKFFYSVSQKSDLKSYNEKLTLEGLSFNVQHNGKEYLLRSNLTGRFNIYNILASVSAVLNYDIDMEQVIKSLKSFSEVSGRFNRVKLPNGAIAVIDYSHTSDSLKNAIESAREIVNEEKKNGRVITIFGCGGNKDTTKRPVMGNFATGLSDHSIITSDNPRYEDPMRIIDDILKGVGTKNNYEVIENRELAIKRGIEFSREGDIVLICGKGHETYQEVNGVKSHFDDKEIVQKYSGEAK